MKTILKLLLIPFLCFLLVASCKKEDDLPKPNQTGANIMAAKIDGQLWQKKACFSCIAGGSALRINYDNRILFAITGEDIKTYAIAIIIKELKNPGIFILGNGKESNTASNYAVVYTATTNFYTSNINTGTITITKLDTVNKIISGTFEFTAENEKDPSNIMKITEGRLDVKYVN